MISYKEFGVERLEEVNRLYAEAGWIAYLGDSEALRRAFSRSLYVLGAFCENRLVGFSRCVGDGEHVVLVQDLIVESAFRHKGIGKELLRRTGERFAAVRTFFVLTDSADENAAAFYRAFGMKPVETCGMTAFFRH